jgi:DNA polymerase-1
MLHRALHAAPSVQATDGAEVGAVLGMVAQVVALMRKARSQHWVVVFDAPGDSFRHRIDPGYKAGRPPPSPELSSQIAMVAEVCRSLGLLTLQVDEVEADDVIATLALTARREGHQSWVVSPDKDLLQLVDDEAPAISIFHPQTSQRINEAAVLNRLGVSPKQAVDYFALTGDSSDNISGVPGVGPKAAQALISAFGSLEHVYARLDEVPALPVRGAKSLRGKLEQGRASAFLARELLQLRDDVPLGAVWPLADCARWRGVTDQAQAVFEGLGDPRHLDRLNELARKRGL